MPRNIQMGYLNFSSACNISFQCFVVGCIYVFLIINFFHNPFRVDVVAVIISYYCMDRCKVVLRVVLLLRCVAPCDMFVEVVLHSNGTYSGAVKTTSRALLYSLDFKHVLI